MTIGFKCRKCGRAFAFKDRFAGKQGKCSCGAVLNIPALSNSADKTGPREDVHKSSGGRNDVGSAGSGRENKVEYEREAAINSKDKKSTQLHIEQLCSLVRKQATIVNATGVWGGLAFSIMGLASWLLLWFVAKWRWWSPLILTFILAFIGWYILFGIVFYRCQKRIKRYFDAHFPPESSSFDIALRALSEFNSGTEKDLAGDVAKDIKREHGIVEEKVAEPIPRIEAKAAGLTEGVTAERTGAEPRKLIVLGGPGSPWPTKVGHFLGLLTAFFLWRLVLGGGVLGAIIAAIAVRPLALPFIVILSLLFGKREIPKDEETEERKED